MGFGVLFDSVLYRKLRMPVSYLLVRVPEGAANTGEEVSKGHVANSCGSSVVHKAELLKVYSWA